MEDYSEFTPIEETPDYSDFTPIPEPVDNSQEGKFNSNFLAYDDSARPLAGAADQFSKGYNDIKRARQMAVGDNPIDNAIGSVQGAIGGAAMAAGTLFNPVSKLMSDAPKLVQSQAERYNNEPSNEARTLTGEREILPGLKPTAFNTGNQAVDTALNFRNELNNTVRKDPLILTAGLGESFNGKLKVNREIPHVTSNVLGEVAFKDGKPLELHEALTKSSQDTLNGVLRNKDPKKQVLNNIGYAEAYRNDPTGVNTTEGLKASADHVASKISNIYDIVKKNDTPVDYRSIGKSIYDATKDMTLDPSQEATRDLLTEKYASKLNTNLKTAIADENNANAKYQKMVLDKGITSHEAQMYKVERDALSDIVDKGFANSGIPNGEKLGMIYRGSKNLSKSIAEAQLRATLNVADKSKITPTAIGAAVYGLGKLAKGVVTGQPHEMVEGGAFMSGALKSFLRRKTAMEMKNPEAGLDKLHREFSRKVKIDDGTAPIITPRTQYQAPIFPMLTPQQDANQILPPR